MKFLIYILPIAFGGFFWANSSRTTASYLPVEVCDNAIDDDNDGLIDLNDTTDCNCPLAIPQSLIPNPSFEERTCCPLDRSQLYCANTWIQASEPTTDYLHTCGWMGWDDLPPPIPFPDGEGCVGFRNGRIGQSSGIGGPEEPNPNWKEYAGACLLSPLKAGVAYRFEFYIGFTKSFNSPPTTIAFYGSTDCENLPFGVNNSNFGCPLNGPGWIDLGELPISGSFEWKLKQINVTPLEDIYAIAIGPNCEAGNLVTSTYYFFDNLVLADVPQFELKIKPSGNPCGNDYALNIPYRDTFSYQWYKDGVALVGETGPSLPDVENVEGNYQVRLIGPNSCKISTPYKLKIPFYSTRIDSVICFGESVLFNQTDLNKSGQYVSQLKSVAGCDSTVTLNLSVVAEGVDTVFAKIFESETYQMGKYSYSEAGEYDAVFISKIGCDSLVHLVLDYYKLYIPNAISPNGDGFNDVFTIFSGPDVKEVLQLEVFDRWGGRVFDQRNLPPNDMQAGWDGTEHGKDATTGVYVWKAIVVFQDGKAREMTGSVTLLR